jgi:hypothetical protein
VDDQRTSARPYMLSVRLSLPERKRLEQAAQRDGMSVSEWIRGRIPPPPPLRPSKLKATL